MEGFDYEYEKENQDKNINYYEKNLHKDDIEQEEVVVTE